VVDSKILYSIGVDSKILYSMGVDSKTVESKWLIIWGRLYGKIIRGKVYMGVD